MNRQTAALSLVLTLSLLPMTGCGSAEEPAQEPSAAQVESIEERVVGAWQHTKGPEVFELSADGRVSYTGRFKPRQGRWTVEGEGVKVEIDSTGEKPTFTGTLQGDMLYLQGKDGTIELKRKGA